MNAIICAMPFIWVLAITEQGPIKYPAPPEFKERIKPFIDECHAACKARQGNCAIEMALVPKTDQIFCKCGKQVEASNSDSSRTIPPVEPSPAN